MDTFHPNLQWMKTHVDRRERGHELAAAGAVLWCLALGWSAFVQGHRVPLLSLVDLGFHELGHLLTYPLSGMVTAAMGSVAQVAVPFGLAVYFAWIRNDRVGTSVCLTWAATAARDVSVYIRDAPYGRLELIGGEHDWAFLLAAHLDRAEPLGRMVLAFGVVLLLAALVLAVSIPFFDGRPHHSAPALAFRGPFRPPEGTVKWAPTTERDHENGEGPTEGHR